MPVDKGKKQRGIKVMTNRPQRVANYEAWVNEPLQNLIKEGLQARDWSISDLARAIHTQPSLVSRWMMGARPSTASLLAISQALALDVKKLLVLAGYLPPEQGESQDERAVMLKKKIDETPMTDERFFTLNSVLESWRQNDPAAEVLDPRRKHPERRRTA